MCRIGKGVQVVDFFIDHAQMCNIYIKYIFELTDKYNLWGRDCMIESIKGFNHRFLVK